MNKFAADWLQRRAPFDAAARSRDLAVRFGSALAGVSGAPRRVVDLAAGSGANFIALAPLIPGDQDWLLIDNDALLLAAQGSEIAGWCERAGWRCRKIGGDLEIDAGTGFWRVRSQCLDLAQSLEQIDFAACDGITTAAFLDLVSAAWLDRLLGLLVHHARPLLAMLTVDGRRLWRPAHPVDARIDDAFARHQARDKGFGPALGARAVPYLAEGLARNGYAASTAPSDWQIGTVHTGMLLQMVQESAAVASETEPAAAALFTEWSAERRGQVGAGTLTLSVGHLDLLALPHARV